MSGLIALLMFGTWILTAVVMAVLLAFPLCRRLIFKSLHGGEQPELQGRHVSLLWVAILVMLSGAIGAAMVWVTGGNILLILMSPLGLTVSALCCILGLIFGLRKLLGIKNTILAGLWVAFLLPPLGISTLRVVDLTVVKDVRIEKGTFTGSKTFHFGNFTSLIVEGDAVEYAFKHYNRARDDMLHVPYDVLELKMDGHRRVVSDQCGNNALIVDGRKYAVTAALRLGAAGSPLMDESVRHPGLPLPVHVKDPLKVE